MAPFYPTILLHETREASNLNKRQVAHMIGMGDSNYSKTENGKLPITPSAWRKLCEVLPLPVLSPKDEVVDILGHYTPEDILEAADIILAGRAQGKI